MIIIDEKLLIYAQKYTEAFGVVLPLRMLPQTMRNEELYAQIDDCIHRGANDLLDRYAAQEPDALY